MLALSLFAALAGCGGGTESPRGDRAPESAPAGEVRYNRELIFVSRAGDPQVIVPFTFRSSDDGSQLHRSSHGWLARGPTWDRFHDGDAVTSRAGGVWRVVPQGDLRVLVGGPAELETLRFVRGERRLRLDLEAPVSEWNQGGEARFRLLSGRLSVGAESMEGPILELLRVERTEADGWPAGEDVDALFVTSGDSLQLVLFESTSQSSPSFAWLRLRGEEQGWERGEIRWLEMRPLEEARRDIPRRWSFAVEGAGLAGELQALGHDALLGPERGGRRAVEIRYSVAGWVDYQDRRWSITGMLRHYQR